MCTLFDCVSSPLPCQYVDCITRLKESLEDMVVSTDVCLCFYPLIPVFGM